MFGLGKRKKYNGEIDIKLNNEYQIDTMNNPLFPGVNAYIELIDNAWKANMSTDEGALYIATLFYCGILKNGRISEAVELLFNIMRIVEYGLPQKIISRERWKKFSHAISDAGKNAEIAAGEENSLYEAENKLTLEFEIELVDLPDRNSVEELYYSMSWFLTPTAKTALLYRLVAMNYLSAAKVADDNGKEVDPYDVLWLTELVKKSTILSESAKDHHELEAITNPLNRSIVNFLSYFEKMAENEA